MPSKTLTPRLLATTLLGAAALGFVATPAIADAKSPTVFEQGTVKIIQKKARSDSGHRDVATNHRGHNHDRARNGRRGDDRADNRRRERKAERRRAERRAERQAERRAERRRQRRWERRRDRRQSRHYSPWSNHGGWGTSNRHRSNYTSHVGISFNFGNDGYSRRRWSSSPHAFYNSNYGSYSTYSNQTYCERVLVQARHHGHYETVSVKQCSNPWDGTYIIQGSERVVNCLY